jgi:hypothetical protein
MKGCVFAEHLPDRNHASMLQDTHARALYFKILAEEFPLCFIFFLLLLVFRTGEEANHLPVFSTLFQARMQSGRLE